MIVIEATANKREFFIMLSFDTTCSFCSPIEAYDRFQLESFMLSFHRFGRRLDQLADG
jgi:hypothetical protein